MGGNVGASDNNLLKVSYGSSSQGGARMVQYKEGKIVLSLGVFFVISFLVIVMGLCISLRNRDESRLKRNPYH